MGPVTISIDNFEILGVFKELTVEDSTASLPQNSS